MTHQIKCTGNNGFIKGHIFNVISETETTYFVEWLNSNSRMTLNKDKRFYRSIYV
jgi:hypothetical protein